VKKKTFSFEESELDWINPLILEWVKENEGKSQSDFMKQLLDDYKSRRGNDVILSEDQGQADKALVKDRFDNFGQQVSDLMEKIRNGFGRLISQSSSKLGQLGESVKNVDVLERIGNSITGASEKLKLSMDGFSKKVKEEYAKLQASIEKRKNDSPESQADQ
jgi:hypothetical protein